MIKLSQTSILFFVLMIIVLSCSAGSGMTTVTDINADQLLELQQQGAIVIDVRTPEEWDETGVIPGAKKAMFFNQQMQPVEDEFLKEINKITNNSDKPVVLYCRSGGRSGKAARLLAEKKTLKSIYNLDGGIKQWLSEDRDTEK
ncbi:MAG: rhodanese-like domain-containing protein [Methylococcales bacterium]